MRPLSSLAALLLLASPAQPEPEWRTAREVDVLLHAWAYEPQLIELPADQPVRLHFVNDSRATMLLRCLGPQPFFHVSEQLYADQRNWVGRLQAVPEDQLQALQSQPPAQQAAALIRATGLDQFFRQRGMPETRMNACLNDQTNLTQLGEISRRAVQEDNVQGTPTFFINGEKKDVGTWATLEPLLQAAVGG